jgi:hypothetical protein
MTTKYFKDTMDGIVVRKSPSGQYEVLWPSGKWAPFEPSYECWLHLEEITPAQAKAAEANTLSGGQHDPEAVND